MVDLVLTPEPEKTEPLTSLDLSYRTMAITTLYTDPPGKLHLSKESQIPVAHHWQRSLDLGLDKTNSGLVQSIRALEHFRANIGDLLFPPDDAV